MTFKQWARDQFGRRPSNLPSHALRADMLAARYAAERAERLYTACEQWDASITAAAYGRNASKFIGDRS